jgi:hypothetical protein
MLGTKPAEAEHILPTQKYADLTLTYNHSKDFPKNIEIFLALIDLYQENTEEFSKKLKELKEQDNAIEKLIVNRRERRIKSDCLHCLIKQISQQKGRPIKIIADWDDCVYTLKPKILHEFGQIDMPFEEFFKHF